jgi:serine/threonine protein kinase
MDGSELGHFSLLDKIGEGGMGRVYKARDKRLDRFVAIKLLAEARSTDADQASRRKKRAARWVCVISSSPAVLPATPSRLILHAFTYIIGENSEGATHERFLSCRDRHHLFGPRRFV